MSKKYHFTYTKLEEYNQIVICRIESSFLNTILYNTLKLFNKYVTKKEEKYMIGMISDKSNGKIEDRVRAFINQNNFEIKSLKEESISNLSPRKSNLDALL